MSDDSHECPLCDEVLSSKSWLGRHMNSEHGETITEYRKRTGTYGVGVVCEGCGDEFRAQENNAERRRFCSRDCKIEAQSLDIVSDPDFSPIVECEWCGEETEKIPSEIADYDRHFCDSDCRQSWETRGTEMRSCAQCGDEIRVVAALSGVRKYCSYECKGKHHSENRVGENNPGWIESYITCEWCGGEKRRAPHMIRGEMDFCSRDCHHAWMGEAWSGENNPRYNRITVSCEWCGKEHERTPAFIHDNHGNFCSRECYARWQSHNVVGQDHHHYTGTKSLIRAVRVNLPGPWAVKREDCRESSGQVCEICEKTKDDNGQELSAHHLVPIESGGVHEDELLMAACQECHRRVELFTKQFTERHLRDWTDEELPEGRTPSREYLEEVSEPGDPYYSGDPPTGQADLSSFAD